MMELASRAEQVLRTLLGVYGSTAPTLEQVIAQPQLHVPTGAERIAQQSYSETLGAQRSGVETHSARDSFVRGVVSETADGTLLGRQAVSRHLTELQSRAQAIATLGDSRFGAPALLDSARALLGSATRQVNADLATARQQAARIVPAAAPARRRSGAGGIRRPRRRIRPSTATIGRRARMPSDGTLGSKAVGAASNWLGTPYIWGGGGAGGPSGGGFDCSGLTQYAIAQATGGEVVLPRTTYDQINSGVRVHPTDVRPGDLVFPGSSFSGRGPEHVQLAAGGGRVIEAPYSGSHVKWSPMPADAIVVRVL